MYETERTRNYSQIGLLCLDVVVGRVDVERSHVDERRVGHVVRQSGVFLLTERHLLAQIMIEQNVSGQLTVRIADNVVGSHRVERDSIGERLELDQIEFVVEQFENERVVVVKEAAYFVAERNEIVLFKLFEMNGTRSEQLQIGVHRFYLHVAHSLLEFDELKDELVGEEQFLAFEVGLSGRGRQLELSEVKRMKQMKILEFGVDETVTLDRVEYELQDGGYREGSKTSIGHKLYETIRMHYFVRLVSTFV